MFTFNNLMLLIPATYNCAIHKIITGFIKMLIYDSLTSGSVVWSKDPRSESAKAASF